VAAATPAQAVRREGESHLQAALREGGESLLAGSASCQAEVEQELIPLSNEPAGVLCPHYSTVQYCTVLYCTVLH